ncbi:MAG TPA: site-specific integrase, partial [Pseudonocardia sp.]|uniref:site-specific integrase n=1 Tax=Pseudonocardia sp. TaxID=60912 RepID=UPI002F3E85B6
MQLFTVDRRAAERYLDSPVMAGGDLGRLLQHRSISDGTPVFLDDETMLPVEPLCAWARTMSYEELSRSTLKDYGRIMARFAAHQAERGRDVVSATESDLVAYRRARTQLQQRPIGTSAWAKESGVLDQFYGFLKRTGRREHPPVRPAARGRNALSPRLRRGMDVRHLTLDQYRY